MQNTCCSRNEACIGFFENGIHVKLGTSSLSNPRFVILRSLAMHRALRCFCKPRSALHTSFEATAMHFHADRYVVFTVQVADVYDRSM